MSYGLEEGQVEITSTHVDDMFAGTLLWVQEHIVEVQRTNLPPNA